MKPKLKPPGTKRLKLTYDKLLSNVAFKSNLRRYILGLTLPGVEVPIMSRSHSTMVGRCSLTLSNQR